MEGFYEAKEEFDLLDAKKTHEQFLDEKNIDVVTRSAWAIDDENDVVQMYINGVYVGDQNDNVISVSGKTITYAPTNNGSYTLTAGDRVQFVFWLTKMLYY